MEKEINCIEDNKIKKYILRRLIIYAAGMIILACGITMNTKTGMGISPIISVPYAISEIWDLNFGNMTFIVYVNL